MPARLWKMHREAYGKEYLLTVLEADEGAQALQRFEAFHYGDFALGAARAEEAATVGQAEQLKVHVGRLAHLDAGTVVRVRHGERELRVVLAPPTTLFEQIVAFLLRQPGPSASWRPTLAEEGAAVARLVFAWGSYFAVISDSTKPLWSGIELGAGRYSDQEQARMSIEISSNMQAVHLLRTGQPETWHHLVYAARSLPGPKQTSSASVAAMVHLPLTKGEAGVERWLKRNLRAEGVPVPRGLKLPLQPAPEPAALAAFDQDPVRRTMNAIALSTWRNPMENFHGDHARIDPEHRPALPLHECRFTAEELVEVQSLMAKASNGFLATGTAMQDRSAEDLRRLLAAPTRGEAGRKWSITEHTRNVILW